MSDQPAATITQIRSVAINVDDQDAALAFYGGVLGFEVRIDTGSSSNGRWIEIAPPGGATTVALIASPEAADGGVDTGIRFTTADVRSDHAALQAAGVDVDAEVSRWPGVPPMFSLRDPQGNTVYVLEG